MEHFSEEYAKQLLSKEWLVKADNQTSTPYLFKFYSHTDAQSWSCYVLLTDTKSVWAEVLTPNQFIRRWHDCNRPSSLSYPEVADVQDPWRTATLDLLSKAHTVAGINDASFEIVETNYSDLAFKLEFDTFKWRWETCFVGHKVSAEVISRHLIFPLVSLNHLVFSSPQPVNEISDADLEKAVDKIGRAARRSVDTHIKNAISKSRIALALRRMVAIFNFIPDVPPINTADEKPDLQVPEYKPHTESPVNVQPRSVSPQGQDAQLNMNQPVGDSSKSPVHADSATESETDDFVMADKDVSPKPRDGDLANVDRHESPEKRASPLPSASKAPDSGSESSPHRPAKKSKPHILSSDDEDSEAERKKRITHIKAGSGAIGGKRGTRQPIKRGGKRF